MSSRSMRAAVIHGPGELRVGEWPVPEPGPGELLIRTLSASICNATDVHIWQGAVGEELRPPYPHVLGHERAGVVERVGDGVDGFAEGDRVACWSKMDGAFAEYDILRPAQYPTVKLSDSVSDDAGSLLEFVGATLRGLHAAALRPGERVLVLGMGVQGLTLAREAKLLGASMVAGVDLVPSRLERARDFGVDVAYNLDGKTYPDALAELRDAVGGEVDVVIDATGKGAWAGGSSVNLALELLAWAGRYIVYALPTGDLEVNARLIGMKGITFKGLDTPPHEVTRLLAVGERWVADGRLPLETFITHRKSLDELEDGLVLCRDCPDDVLKVMIDVS